MVQKDQLFFLFFENKKEVVQVDITKKDLKQATNYKNSNPLRELSFSANK
jgi:hypothetical protein